MIHRLFRTLILSVALVQGALLSAQVVPTEMRSWKSTAGTSIEARATALVDGKVSLETADGRKLEVPMEKISEADQAFVKSHFGAVESGSVNLPARGQPPVGLPHSLGEVTGPIESDGSSYYVYLPPTLVADRAAPMLFFTGSGGGNAEVLKVFLEGANLAGWIIACSVESKNGATVEENHRHAKNCLDHLKANLPVDPKRVYFGGNSGGARMAFHNNAVLDGAGVLAIVAGAAEGQEIPGKLYHFINGAYDFNRADSAASYGKLEKDAAFRFYPGGHNGMPAWMATEGMLWLEGMHHRRMNDDNLARRDFEAAVIAWADGLRKASNAHRAYSWADFFRTSKVMADNQPALDALLAATASSETNKAYVDALASLEGFARRTLATGPREDPARHGHTSEEIQQAMDRLTATYPAAPPWIKEIFLAAKKPTD